MKNGLTTIAGVIGGLLTAIMPLIADGKWNWSAIASGAAIALVGILAKDFNTTGAGTTATKP